MKKKIVFISHYAARTGAPIVLLHFLQWLKANTAIPFEIVSKRGGVLSEDFQKTAPTHVCSTTRLQRYLERISSLAGFGYDSRSASCRRAAHSFRRSDTGLIYCNTITNGEMLEHFSGFNCPVICHVHELETEIQRAGRENIERIKRYTDHYIAVSEGVKSNLTTRHGIPAGKIDIVYPFVDTSAVPEHPEDIRSAHAVPQEAFVVCGSGTGSWRKGKDLFVQLAYVVSQRPCHVPIRFLWIGGSSEGPEADRLHYDIDRLEVNSFLHLIPDIANPIDYFCASDVFVLVSREDPFPLVCLEASAAGKPVICFDKAGGMPEFVESDAGFVVPYLDIAAMADRIIELAQNPELRKKLGQCAARKVRSRHDVSYGAGTILEIVNRYI